MNKGELVDLIAKKSGLTKAHASKALDAVMESVTETLTAGESIILTGFGTFSVKTREEKTGRNPKTGAPLTIPAKSVPHFSAGKSLKDAVGAK